jgi:hypothetical protein
LEAGAMKTNERRTLIAGAAIAVATMLMPNTPSAARTEDVSGVTPYLIVSIQNLSPGGIGGAEAAVSWDLREYAGVAPPVMTGPLVAGGSNEFPSDICAISSGGPDFVPGALVGWRVKARLLSMDADGARVWLQWKRSVMDPTAVDATDLAREYEVRLIEGAPRAVIDLVRPPSGTNPSCDGVVVKVGFEFRDKRELSNSVLDYDVWLVHREADGREVVDRTAGRGAQGKRIDYLFRRLQYKPDGTSDGDREIDIDLKGSVKGRVRPDGRIDLSISAARMVIQGALGSGEEGNKKATVADGDTLELELPPHLAHGPRFSAQRTSIRVTVRRVS